jgi:hypothetical protein
VALGAQLRGRLGVHRLGDQHAGHRTPSSTAAGRLVPAALKRHDRGRPGRDARQATGVSAAARPPAKSPAPGAG